MRWAWSKASSVRARMVLARSPGIPEVASERFIPPPVRSSRRSAPAPSFSSSSWSRGSGEQIIRIVSVASEGERVVPRELLNDLVADKPTPELLALSPRQREILELVVEGPTNAQIAWRLFLSESTIKQHLRLAYKLLGIKSRTQAAQLLRQSKLA
jgi:DNA-binding NarL/FixJ family response regulator